MKSRANLKAKGLAKSGLKNLLTHKAHNEEAPLQRGGSVSHRRARSDCLQNRLPITQHFGMSRPRRPPHNLSAARVTDGVDAWDGAVSGPARPEPDPGLQRSHEKQQEEEEEEAMLCDPEEMDLLGEIFDTLSTRSSHERGLLYGTRSLDLFGPDSHDYITKRCPANPSHESLSLSISGSGSLHSWNTDAAEDASDLDQDPARLFVDTCAPEEEEEEEEEEGPPVACEAGEITEGSNFQEVKSEEEHPASCGEEAEKEKRESQTGEEEGDGQRMEDFTNETQKDAAGEEEPGECLDQLVEPEASPRPRGLAADPSTPEKRGEDAGEQAERENRGNPASPPPPKVLSAVARFQSQAPGQGFRAKSGTRNPAEENPEEEDPPPIIKVSELKKRFEAP